MATTFRIWQHSSSSSLDEEDMLQCDERSAYVIQTKNEHALVFLCLLLERRPSNTALSFADFCCFLTSLKAEYFY